MVETAGARWVDYSVAEDKIPDGANLGGTDIDGAVIYIGRAHHEGDLLPAKIIPKRKSCFVCYGGVEIAKDYCEVMVRKRYSWKSSACGLVPEGAIEVGETADGETLYIGRVHFDGCITPGKIHPSEGVCYYPFDGEERSATEYEVLVFT